MDIVAHRGIWYSQKEQNSYKAIKRAIKENFSFETDFRDFNNKICISHDPIKCFKKKLKFKKIIKIITKKNYKKTIAINIKSDGIIGELTRLLNMNNLSNYFIFDMSIPEMIKNNKEKIFIGVSDVIGKYDNISFFGYWIDAFYDYNWITKDKILSFLESNKSICFVSPELHGKDYLDLWIKIKEWGFHRFENVHLCTDLPHKAKEFFNE